MSKKNQMQTVYNIVKYNQPMRTEQVKIMAMQAGCSCADRYLRWLRKDGYVNDKKFDKDSTKTWYTTDKAFDSNMKQPTVSPIVAEQSGQFCMVSVAVCFCLAASLLFGAPVHADPMPGKVMTKIFEGYRSQVYICPGGKRTIGYGFNIEDPQVKELISFPVLSGKATLEKQEAEHVFDVLYREAIKNTILFLGKDTFYRLSNNQRYIIVDMTYNLGSRRLRGFKRMRAAIVAGDYGKAADEMKDSKWYRQTGRRAKHHVENFGGK